MSDLGYDPTDIEGQRRRKRQADDKTRLDAAVAAEDFQWLMKDKRGRRFIWSLLERTGVFRSSFTGNSETFFREGQRNVGLLLMAQIHEACPEQYAVMLQEQKTNDRRDDAGRPSTH